MVFTLINSPAVRQEMGCARGRAGAQPAAGFRSPAESEAAAGQAPAASHRGGQDVVQQCSRERRVEDMKKIKILPGTNKEMMKMNSYAEKAEWKRGK